MTHSESISFYSGEKRENRECHSRFESSVSNFKELAVWQALVNGLLQVQLIRTSDVSDRRPAHLTPNKSD